MTEQLLATARRAADAASAVHTARAGRVRLANASAKHGPGDLVSEVDLDAQRAALGVIGHRHPDHAILAEEEGLDRTHGDPSRPLWIVDPLDGTANYLHGHPMACASVAVAVDGALLAGAVTCHATGEAWWAGAGLGAWKCGRRLRPERARSLAGGLVGTGFPFKKTELIPRYLPQLGALLARGIGVRRAGSAAMDLCYLAEGRFDAFWELDLNPWDFAAAALIVEEAGGVMGDVGGGALALAPGSVAGAGSATLLDELLSIVSKA